ncbi:MAG: discoidin domain-containing protein [Vicinamibacterales bacterium]
MQCAGAGLIYTLLTAAVTWPLLRDASTLVASDTGDPILNASILVWNATVPPLTAAWWNAPHFFPATGVVAFTENLIGLYPIASPLYWLTGNAVLAYNLTLFLLWPLSALAVYLLVRRLTDWPAAAFVAGLAFAFTPMRAVAVPHIQTMATFGLPLCLFALHGYLQERRWPWLLLAGAAWLQQGFANGYYILYGGLAVGLWVLYFCSARVHRRAAGPIVVTGVLASLPLIPMLLRYRAIHEESGARRSLEEIVYFSARPHAWLEVGELSWLWHGVLPPGKDNLFPGIAVPVLLVTAAVLAWRERTRERPLIRPGARVALGLVACLSAAAVLFVLWRGPVNTAIGPIAIKLRQLDRALLLLALSCGALLWTWPAFRRVWTARTPGLFYGTGIGLFAVLACGPVLQAHGRVVLDPAPYGWLMALPGFDELRVPTQIKMAGLLCLSVSAGLALASLGGRLAGRSRVRTAAAGVVAVAVLVDGWLRPMPMAEPQPLWPVAEAADRQEPLLELPLGPAWDGGATFRAARHRRRVVNGVSGYDPPHYAALREGLEARDPGTLTAVATLGPLDVVVDGAADPDGSLARYVAATPGVARVTTDGPRSVFRLPAVEPPRPLGPALPVARVEAVRHPGDARLMLDGNPATGWTDVPPLPGSWVAVDLGTGREVAGVTLVMGRAFFDFPRRLAIDVSTDGVLWAQAWEGPTFAQTFLGFVRTPRNGTLALPLEPVRARHVRVRRLDVASPAWHVAEVSVHAARR